MLEHEYKYLVSKAAFAQQMEMIRSLYGAPEGTALQRNHYYDTMDLALHRQGVTLRIREKGREKTLQRKLIKSQEAGLRTAEETEWSVTDIPEVLDSAAFGLQYGKLRRLGALETLRTSFRINSATRVEFDRSRYFDVVDYEVEIEIAQAVPQQLFSIFQSCASSQEGKYSRFLHRYLAYKEGLQ